MKRPLVPIAALLAASPAYALPIISLHGGGAWHVQFSSTMVDAGLLAASIAALGATVAFRMLRRKAGRQRR